MRAGDEILIEKISRNSFCKKFLIETGERALFEGMGDRTWGCGFLISKADQISFKNPGKNLIKEVRNLLVKKEAKK